MAGIWPANQIHWYSRTNHKASTKKPRSLVYIRLLNWVSKFQSPNFNVFTISFELWRKRNSHSGCSKPEYTESTWYEIFPSIYFTDVKNQKNVFAIDNKLSLYNGWLFVENSQLTDLKFEWKQCWSPWRIIDYHRRSRAPKARDISKFWKIRPLKQHFLHFYMIWGQKGRLRYDWGCVFSLCFSQPWRVGRFQSSNTGRTCMRQVGQLGSMQTEAITNNQQTQSSN